MVRHGTFSRGCQTCRTRKIKCDKAIPACAQCLKAGWSCPQYGDLTERMFQHKASKDFKQSVDPELLNPETRLVKASDKLCTSDPWSFCKAAITTTAIGSLPGPNHYESYDIKLCPNITKPIHHRAIDYFHSTHVFQECGIPRGYYEYLAALVDSSRCTQPLDTSLRAVALAAYAYTFRYPELLQQARWNYGRALQLMKIALSSPEEFTSDSTLSSVLLLNTFNTLTGEANPSLEPCFAHTTAATSIMSLNGHALMETRTLLPLVLQLLWSLLQTYITYSVRIPGELINLRHYAANALDSDYPGWKLFTIITDITDFRADVKEGILLDSDSIVKIALSQDSRLLSLADNMPAQWLFQSIPRKEMSELVFGSCYHVYPDQWVAFIWSCLRVSRLLLHKEIQSRLIAELATSALIPSDPNNLQCRTSAKTLHQMTSGICATVPQCSGYLEVLNGNQTLTKTSYSSGKVTNGIPVIAGAYLTLWPLLNSGLCTESILQRNWIVGRCRHIGRMTGIQQALVFADVVEQGDTNTTLGKYSPSRNYHHHQETRDLAHATLKSHACIFHCPLASFTT